MSDKCRYGIRLTDQNPTQNIGDSTLFIVNVNEVDMASAMTYI